MHIGAALVFDPLPAGGTPEIAEFRDYVRSGSGSCRASPSSSPLRVPVR